VDAHRRVGASTLPIDLVGIEDNHEVHTHSPTLRGPLMSSSTLGVKAAREPGVHRRFDDIPKKDT
jgi:hypothetical protein